MKREYFYKEHGQLKPYHYCSECGKRFTDDEFKKGLILNVASKSTPIKYCATPCYQIKFQPATPKISKTNSKTIKDPEQELIPELMHANGMFVKD